ncbi:MAG: hypothetical protein RI897_2061 [Verrucomicrobiota bacterium]
MRYPFIGVLLPYVFGVLLGASVEVPLGLLFVATWVLVMAWWLWLFWPGGGGWRNERAASWVLIAALVAAGWLNIRRHTEVVSLRDVRLWPGGEAVLAVVEARLAGVPELRAVEDEAGTQWRTRVVLDLERIRVGGREVAVRGRALATYPGQLGPGYGQGARVRVYGVLKEPPGAAAPGLFDQRSYGLRKGITHLLVTDEPGDWRLVSGGVGEGFLAWAARTLAKGLPEEDPATRLRWAMLLGWRGVMTEELREPFLHSGTMHVFAISGLHISLVSIILTSVLRLLRVPRARVGAVVLPALWCYVSLTGWQASAVRASVMMSVVVAGWALRRPSDLLNSLAGAAFLLLVWDPRQLGDAGFQLSFGVVLSLAILVPGFSAWGAKRLEPEPWLPPEYYSSRWEKARDLAYKGWTSCSVSAAAWMGSAPLVAWYFHVLTPVSLVLNLWVVPLAGVVVLAGLCSLAAGAWWDWGTECFNASGWLAMRLMLWASQRGEELPGAWWPVARPPVSLVLGYYGVLLWVFLRASGVSQAWNRVWLGTSLGLVAFGLATALWDRSRGMEVVVLPVRGGDCVWVDLPGTAGDVLLDSGDARAAEWVVGPYLRAQGLSEVPVLVLSHGDAGHVGGVPALLADFGVRELWMSPFEARSRVYRDVVSGLVDAGVEIRRLERGLSLGPWRVLHPVAGDPFTRADDQALVLLLEWEGFRVLFCSDLGRQGQLRLLEREPGLRADVLVAGLPGEEGEFLIDGFLDAVSPRAVVVSCGGLGREGIVPRENHLRLERRGAPVLWTREAGAVRLRVRGGRLEVEGMDGRRLSLTALAAEELTGAAHAGHHALKLAHLLHHLLHLAEPVQKSVEFGDGGAATGCNAAAAAGVQDLRSGAFLKGHRADHALHPFELLLTLAEVRLFHGFTSSGQEADDVFQRAQFLHLPQLLKKVVERELASAHLLFQLLRLVEIDRLGRLFHQADDVAHAEDARGHSLGVEGFEVLELFTGADEFDGFAGDRFQAEGGAAPGVTVEFGEDRAGDLEGLVEMGGDVDRFLASGGVEDEEDLLGFDEIAQADQFLDEGFVDLEAAGGIKDQRVAERRFGVVEGFTGDLEDVFFAMTRKDGDVQLLAQSFELVHGGGAVDVSGHEEGLSTLFKEEAGEFGGGGCFSRAMEAHEHEAGRISFNFYAGVGGAEETDHFIMNDFDDLLAGLNTPDYFCPKALGLDAFDEVAGDLKIDIGFEESHADLPKCFSHIGFRDLSQAPQVAEGLLEFTGQRIEHGGKVGGWF